MLDWFTVNRQLVSRAELWILSRGIGVLLLMTCIRAGWMFYKFKSFPLSDMQILLPAVCIGVLIIANWTLKGLIGQLVGGAAGICCWLLAWFMNPWQSWPMADLPQWIVYAGLGFLLFAWIYTGLARSASRLRLRLHGRDWIIRHLRSESFYRRLDAHSHLGGLGLSTELR